MEKWELETWDTEHAHYRFMMVLGGVLRAETIGGPQIFDAGYFIFEGRKIYFIEMELVFSNAAPGNTISTTEAAAMVGAELSYEDFFLFLAKIARLFALAVKNNVTPIDSEMLINLESSEVRWIDGDFFTDGIDFEKFARSMMIFVGSHSFINAGNSQPYDLNDVQRMFFENFKMSMVREGVDLGVQDKMNKVVLERIDK